MSEKETSLQTHTPSIGSLPNFEERTVTITLDEYERLIRSEERFMQLSDLGEKVFDYSCESAVRLILRLPKPQRRPLEAMGEMLTPCDERSM